MTHAISVYTHNRSLSKLSERSDEDSQFSPGPMRSLASTALSLSSPVLEHSEPHVQDTPFLPPLQLGKLGVESECSKETVSSQFSRSSGRENSKDTVSSQFSRSNGSRHRGSLTSRSPKKKSTTPLSARTQRSPYWQMKDSIPILTPSKDLQSVFHSPASPPAFKGEDGVGEVDEKAETLQMLTAAMRHGYLLRELRLAQNGWRRSWTPFQPFRYRISAIDQVMSRFEKMGGVWARDALGDVVQNFTSLARAHDAEELTSSYPLDGCQAGILEENLAEGIGPGCGVWIKVHNKTLRLWAEGEHAGFKIGHMIRVISIASNRTSQATLFSDAHEQDGQHGIRYKIGVTAKSTMIGIAEDPSTFKQLHSTGQFQLRSGDLSSVWSMGYGRRRDEDIMVVISRQWKGYQDQRKVVDKLWLAGAASTSDLVKLIEAPAPVGCDYLPRWTFFRGRACLLNYRIDINGGKMIRSETLESLHKFCLMPLEAEIGYDVVHSEMIRVEELPTSEQHHTAELQELMTRIWPDKIRAQQSALTKIMQAGVKTIDDLHWMLTHDAPSGYKLPKRALVGERACMLNYRVDRIGQKLFTAETLLLFKERLDFRLTLSKGTLPKSIAEMKEMEEKKLTDTEKRAIRRRKMIKDAEDSAEFHGKLNMHEIPRCPKSFGIPAQVLNLTFNDEASLLALSRSDGVVTILRCKGQPTQWKACAELHRHRSAVNLCCFRPSHVDPSFPNVVLASAGSDGTVCIWDLDGLLEQPPHAARCIRVVQHSVEEVLCCTFSRDGRRLAHGNKGGVCEISEVWSWNPFNAAAVRPPTPTRDYTVETTLVGHERAITCVTFSNDPNILASSSLDESVRLWCCRKRSHEDTMDRAPDDGESKSGFYEHWECTHVVLFPGPVSYITFSPKGMLVIANCMSDDRAYAWDLEAMLDKMKPWEYQVLDCGDEREEIVCTSAAMKSNCAWVAIGLDQGGVWLWHWDKGVSAAPMFQQTARVTDLPRNTAGACALSPSASYLVTASSNIGSPFSADRLSPGSKGVPPRSPSSPESFSPSSPGEIEETTVAIFDLEQHQFSRSTTAPPFFHDHAPKLPQLHRTPSLSAKRRQQEDEKVVELVSRLVEAKGSSGMWVSEIVAEAEARMGSEFQTYLQHRSSAMSMHAIAMKEAYETIAFLVKSNRTMGGAKGPQGTELDPPGSKEADVISDRQEARERLVASRVIALEREDDEGNVDCGEEANQASSGIRSLVRGGQKRGNVAPALGGPGLVGVMEMAMQSRRGSQEGPGNLGLETPRTRMRRGGQEGNASLGLDQPAIRRRGSQAGADEPGLNQVQRQRRGSQEGAGLVLEQPGRTPRQRPRRFSQEGLGVEVPVPGEGRAKKKGNKEVLGIEGRTSSKEDVRFQRRGSNALDLPVQLRGRRSSFVGPETFGRAESTAGSSAGRTGRAGSRAGSSNTVLRDPMDSEGAIVWTNEEIEREKEAKEAKLTEWLCSWPKLFQIVWNSYVFRGHGASLHKSISVGAFGREAVKTARTDRSPTSVLLFPPIRAGLTTEVEFLIQHMYHVPHDALRVGVCTGRHHIGAGESAGSSNGGWMFGCGTGMKFHNREAHSYTKQHVKQGDKVGVFMDRPHGQVSIKINGVNQGKMFAGLPMQQDLYFVVDLVCAGEAVAMTDVLVRQSWGKALKTIPIDPLHFRCS